MTCSLFHRTRLLARNMGIDVLRFPSLQYPAFRRSLQLKSRGIDLLIDVGASTGGYAAELRKLGFEGVIASFEPLEGPFSVLEKQASRDPSWFSYQIALGRRQEERTMQVSRNSVSSSLAMMLPRHREASPESQFVEQRSVHVAALDDYAEGLQIAQRRPFLKIDTQGWESEVLAGASETLPYVIGLQVELALEHLYEGDLSLAEGMRMMRDLGFRVSSIEPGFTDPSTGDVLQADAIFFRDSS